MMPSSCVPIVCYGTGYDGVDHGGGGQTQDLRSATAPAPMPRPLPIIAVTLMLAATRRLLPADNYVRSGRLGRPQNRRR